MAILEGPIKEVLILKNYINGEWVESKSEQSLDVINPATQKTLAKVPMSTRDEVNAAVAAAKQAFPEWRRTPPPVRARYLFKLKSLLEENLEELARVQTQEHGRIISESRGAVGRGIECVEVATEIPSLMMGYNLHNITSGVDEILFYDPLGAFCNIAPFNFPFMVPLWFAPFALATGNSFIVKPSPNTPISLSWFTKLLEEVNLPPGVWNLVQGGAEASLALLEHPDIVGVTFVGSTKVGRDVIYKKCGETGKRAIVQTSAKNYIIVMPDANLEETIPYLIPSFFGNTGQRCLSGANLLIVGKDNAFYNKVLNMFVDAASKITVGSGLDESVGMGPMNSVDGKKRVLGYIAKGMEEGAKLILDGRKPNIVGDYPDTCFLNPTIFEGVTTDMTIGREEIFGPVVSVMRAKDLDEAIKMVNSSRYGNGVCIFTASGKAARAVQFNTQCGNIGINVSIPCTMMWFPFCGMKDSFFGIEHGQGREAIRFFTDSRVVTQRWT